MAFLGEVRKVTIRPVAPGQPVAQAPATAPARPDSYVSGGPGLGKFGGAVAVPGAARYLAGAPQYDHRGIGLCKRVGFLNADAAAAERPHYVDLIGEMARECVAED